MYVYSWTRRGREQAVGKKIWNLFGHSFPDSGVGGLTAFISDSVVKMWTEEKNIDESRPSGGPVSQPVFTWKFSSLMQALTTARPLLSSRGTHISLLCFFKHYLYSIHLLRSSDYFKSRFGLFILNWTHLIFYLRIRTFYFRVPSILRNLFILGLTSLFQSSAYFFQIRPVHFLFDLCMYF